MTTDIFNNKNEFIKKDNLEINSLLVEISNYNIVDFLMGVSALMLFPQNQSKSVIFQSMINAALSLPVEESTIGNKMSINTFKKIVRGFENSSISLLVDPPEFPFILPVLYFENPYVFMGNNSLSPLYLNNILKVFEANKGKIDFNQYNNTSKIINGLLSISNDIVKELNIKMEDLEFFPVEEEIFIPSKQKLDLYKEYINISADKMISMFCDNITNYVSEYESIEKDEIICSGDPKYIFKPFIKYKNNYVLLDVTCILPLLFKIIIKETYDINSVNIISEYNKLCSLELSRIFFMLGCKELNPKELKLIKDEDYEEKVFLLGNDSIVINIQLFDVGNNLSFGDIYEDIEFRRSNNYIYQRVSYLSNYMISKAIDSSNILIVVSPYTLGRNFVYSLKGCDPSNILILSLYELSAISINEEENKFFLREYIDSRKRLKNYQKNLFSELNFVALFTKYGNSFYTTDDLDVKESLIYITGEYSSDYILKAYIRESKRLCAFYGNKTLIEVIKIDKSIYFSPQLFLEKRLNKVIIDNDSVIWIINEHYDMGEYVLYQLMSDFISYWFSELLPFQCDNYNITICLNIDAGLSSGIESTQVIDDISKIFKYDIGKAYLRIYITEELCNYFNRDTNNKEKEFIKFLLSLLDNNFNLHVNEHIIDKVFNNPYKRKLISIDPIDDAYMIPSRNSECNRVSSAQENIVLDEIGEYLK